MNQSFLPINLKDMQNRGWEAADFVLVTGDAYVDHPSFGAAIISRVLENEGYKIAILSQPDWKSINDFKRFGRPRLGFLVTSGNLDSMVAHYTATKKPRSEDSYSPGGKKGYRPDRAVLVYCNKIREAYGDIPIVIGGIEASLRRFAHYDYWEDKLRKSILVDSSADILLFGMAERAIVELANALNEGQGINALTYIDGTAYMTKELAGIQDAVYCPSYEQVVASKRDYAKSVKQQYEQHDPIRGKTLVQKHGDWYVVQNKPALPLSRPELDKVYSLPYQRAYHPIYEKAGGVPAIEEVEFSIISSRGCFGACNFCALGFHQGRIVQSRSQQSIINEAKNMVWKPNFKGYIHDVGGPTANFRQPACSGQLNKGACKGKQCLFPTTCGSMEVSHSEYLQLLRKLREIEGVKKVFVRSGIRYDYVMADKDPTFLRELIKHHTSGQLKVAPEHVSPDVLKRMGKPSVEVYKHFSKRFYDINKQLGLKQFLVPYLISGHPGSTLKSAIELALYLKKEGINPQQVQDFYPTPGAISTCMYYTGIDPITSEGVYVPKLPEEKAMQRALLQFKRPENRMLVIKALKKAGRSDLIGYGPDCLLAMPRENRQKAFKKGPTEKGKAVKKR